MKIILMDDVESLGHAGQIMEVKDGYARNFLLPKGLAKRATAANVKLAAQLEKQRLAKLEKLKQQAQELADKISAVSCTIAVKVGEEDKLYGTVTSQNISDALAKEGYEIDKKDIILEEPIKELGVYSIAIRVHAEVSATLKVWVVAE